MLRHFFLSLVLAATAFAGVSNPIWPSSESDLPIDPALHTGTLPNGLRYLIRPNAEPKGHVSLRLLVAAGSMQERDDERGLAHFVEHMVFRGTRQHPNGSMTTELQRLGVGFGPDSTAFTNFRHTIYHLDLPDTQEATLRKGFSVLREYAGDVTFDAALIDKERGVILSEKDTRDTPGARQTRANLAFLWPGSREARRDPIGLEELVKTFTRDKFVGFYDAWYRPERMAVIVVGDIDATRIERLLAENFSTLAARGPARPDPDYPAALASHPNVVIFSDPGLVGAACLFEHPYPDPHGPDTHVRRVRQLHRALAFSMFQRRVAKDSVGSESEGVGATASATEWLRGWDVAAFGMSGRISDWKKFIGEIEQEHRRAYLHGFDETELKAAKRSFANSLDENTRTAATWPSSWIANQFASALVEGNAISTPAAMQRDLAAPLEATTIADCEAAFREAWTKTPPHVFVATNPLFAVTAKEVAAALNQSRQTKVAALPHTALPEFAYTTFGTAGTVAKETYLSDLDVRQAEFTNGVRLNFKPTAFEADTVDVYVKIGRGRLSQPRTQPGLNLLAEELLPHGGLSRHTFEELTDILAGHAISVSFKVESDAFDFNARCGRRDLALCLQVIAAYLTDAAYRPTELREIRASFGSLYASLASSAGGPISAYSARILAGGDPRFGFPTPVELEARTGAEVSRWLEPEFKHSPIELSIVGEANWAEACDAVGRTLGALAARPGPVEYRRSETLRTAKPAKPTYVYTTAPELKQVALAWFCPMRDPVDAPLDRRCRLLASLLTERLRLRLREELGAAYDCSADFAQIDGFPAFNYFTVYAEVAPGRAETANRLIRDELESLRKKRFTDDEFERAKVPYLRLRDESLRTNSYWGYTVLRDAQERPERIAAARSRTADTATITRVDLEKLAKRYFQPKHCFQFVAYPGKPAPVKYVFGRSSE